MQGVLEPRPKLVMNPFGKRNSCSQWEGRSMHSRQLVFFLLSFGVGGGRGRGRRIIFIFPWFPMCSHYVPFNFSMGFHRVFNMFLKFPACSSTCPPWHLTFMLWQMLSSFHTILGGPKGRNSILQNRTFYFRESL